eukprot:TRINITY_DN14357_c0_g1_i1.p1 TRINITY_DN14357_c0_g1~~TRINITY_DN14357_c0_g1_i1.p1  ORF type:complete len:302 (+),score=22.93 TRINITY_DN14357_c0_g1_i1:15-920(+)
MGFTDLSQSTLRASLAIHPETLRIVAYILFWMMVALAMTLSHLLLKPGTLEGSPLMMVMGYNNICVYWDYPEVETYVAMFYPFVEIPLVAYVTLLQFRWQQLTFPSWVLKFIGNVFGGIAVLCCLWFRLIFVHKAFDSPIDDPTSWPKHDDWAAPNSVLYHTLPFWGLQFALAVVGLQNFYYYVVLDAQTKASRNQINCAVWKWNFWSIAYIVAQLSITATKLFFTISVFTGAWDVYVPGSNPPVQTWVAPAGRVMDVLWMIVSAVIPLVLAFYRRRQDPYSSLQLGVWSAGPVQTEGPYK